MKGERLSNRQIATLKHLAVCCANGGQITLTRDQREAMVPLWRRELIEIWNRQVPGEAPRGPFFRPAESGWRLIQSILEAADHFSDRSLPNLADTADARPPKSKLNYPYPEAA